MSYRQMTARAAQAFCRAMRAAGVNVLGDGGVAVAACAFHHLAIKLCDLDNVRILPGGEIEGVKKAVAGLDRILANDIVRCMAVIALSLIHI